MTNAKRRRLLGFGAAVAALAAWPGAAAEPLLAQIRARLADAPVLRGRFEQRKSVQGFRHPLVSGGEFVVARARGVLWHTSTPFESMLVVTRERLRSRQADGGVDQTLDAAEPALRAVNETLFALLAADLAALAQRFDVAGALDGALGWRVTLTPRDAALARWLTRVELDGDRHVRALRLTEASGDATLIRFSDQSAGAALTAEEAARFD